MTVGKPNFDVGSTGDSGGQEAKKVVDTIQFVNSVNTPSTTFVDQIKESLISLPDNSNLKDSVFILLEEIVENRMHSKFFGIAEAQKIIRQNLGKKVVLYSIVPLRAIKEMNPQIETLLAKKNVRFMDLFNLIGGDPNKISKIFDEDSNTADLANNSEISKQSNLRILEITESILHGIQPHYVKDPYNPESEEEPKVNHAIAEARKDFPSLEGKSSKEILDFLFETRKNFDRPEPMKGENVQGVFCDVEGTLILDGKVNESVLEKLKEYEKIGKNITLWTDGNLEELQKIIDKNGIKYPLKSKFNYAGAIAEIVIDDTDENTFNARTKIYAKEFIPIESIKQI